MPTIASSVSEFIGAIGGIFFNILNSILAVFQSILALGQDLLGSVFHLGQSLLKLATDLTGSLAGFVLANIFTILILGGVYYVYTNYYAGRSRSTKKRV